jgi:hypothetical protein
MTARIPKYSKEEHARRGTQAYETRVRSQVETGGRGKIVAIDVDSDDFEIGESSLVACQRLLARRPSAQIWCIRIGFPVVDQLATRVAGERVKRTRLIQTERYVVAVNCCARSRNTPSEAMSPG